MSHAASGDDQVLPNAREAIASVTQRYAPLGGTRLDRSVYFRSSEDASDGTGQFSGTSAGGLVHGCSISAS